MNKTISLIGMPIFQGCDRQGVETAPSILMPIIEQQLSPLPCITSMIPVSCKQEDDGIMPIKYRDDVLVMCQSLAKEVDDSFSGGMFPFVVGGDHTLGMASIAGVSKHVGKENLSVIWFDAHTDINTERGTPSRNAHGMPLAASLNLMLDQDYNDLLFKGPKIKTENLHYFGGRSIDKEEASIIKKHNIHLISSQRIKDMGIEQAVESLIQSINTPYVHLSFDLDVLDPEVFGATGVKESNGLSFEAVSYTLKALFESLPIVSFDLVEYHPQLDHHHDINKVTALTKTIIDVIKGPK